MFKKIMSLGLALAMMLTMGTSAFAATTTVSTEDVSNILEDIVEYSSYNYQSKSWDLDYAIVEDGVLTVAQYNDAVAAGEYYEEMFPNENTPQTRVLPAAVVLVLKAIAAAGGAALVVEITQDIYNYGMTAACEAFSGVDLFYDFCVANDYI